MNHLVWTLTLLLACSVLAWMGGCTQSSGSAKTDDAGVDGGDTDADTDGDTDIDLCEEEDEVRQPETSYCWRRCPLGQTWTGTGCEGDKTYKNWCDASGENGVNACTAENPGVNICQEMFGDGYRLPTEAEFRTLLENCSSFGQEYDCSSCDGDEGQTTCTDMLGSDVGSYWSSVRASAGWGVNYAWFAEFGTGRVKVGWIEGIQAIRCLH